MFFILDEVDFCEKFQFVINIVGYLFKIIRYVIPAILIVLATIDVVQVVISPDEKKKKDAGSKIGQRLIYAVVIFLVPMFIKMIFNILANNQPEDFGGESSYQTTWIDCANRIFN